MRKGMLDAEHLLSFWEPGIWGCAMHRCCAVEITVGGWVNPIRHMGMGLWKLCLVSRCTPSSFGEPGRCPLAIINHNCEDNYILSPRESPNLGVVLGTPKYWENEGKKKKQDGRHESNHTDNCFKHKWCKYTPTKKQRLSEWMTKQDLTLRS